jgi:hypothetical protein
MVHHARSLGLRYHWVGMDARYGKEPWLLRTLDLDAEIWLADVHCDQRIYLEDPHPIAPERRCVGNIRKTYRCFPAMMWLKCCGWCCHKGTRHSKISSGSWRRGAGCGSLQSTRHMPNSWRSDSTVDLEDLICKTKRKHFTFPCRYCWRRWWYIKSPAPGSQSWTPCNERFTLTCANCSAVSEARQTRGNFLKTSCSLWCSCWFGQ